MNKQAHKCSIYGCGNQIVPCFEEPKSKATLNTSQERAQAAHIPYLNNSSNKITQECYYICDHHFKDDEFWTAEINIRNTLLSQKVSTPNRSSDVLLANHMADQYESYNPSDSLTITDAACIDYVAADPSNQQLVDDSEILYHLNISDTNLVEGSNPCTCTFRNKITHCFKSKHDDRNTSGRQSEKCYTFNTKRTETDSDSSKDTQIILEQPYFKSIKCFLQDRNDIAEVCRICFIPFAKQEKIIKLHEDSSQHNVSKIKDMLNLVLPDLDLKLYPNTVICLKCVDLLEHSYKLKSKWLLTEERLLEIIKKNQANIKSNEDLITLGQKRKTKKKPNKDSDHINNTLDRNKVETTIVQNNVGTLQQEAETETKHNTLLEDYSYHKILIENGNDTIEENSTIENNVTTIQTQMTTMKYNALADFNCINEILIENGHNTDLIDDVFIKNLTSEVNFIESGGKTIEESSMINKPLEELNCTDKILVQDSNDTNEDLLTKNLFLDKKKKQNQMYRSDILKQLLAAKPSPTSTKRQGTVRIYSSAPYLCDQCGKMFQRRNGFWKHLRRHLNPPSLKQRKRNLDPTCMCEICGKLCLTNWRLKLHYQKHKEHKCCICNKVYNSTAQLKAHVSCKHFNNYYQCHICGKRFCYLNNMKEHIRTQHNPASRIHSCNICDKKFFYRHRLTKHIHSHISGRLLKCKYCGKCIKYKWSLKKHIDIFHLGKGKHICEFCNQVYWKKCDLSKHYVRVHGKSYQHEVKSEEN